MSKGLETLREIGEEVIKVNCLAGWIVETVKEAYGIRFDGIEEELEDGEKYKKAIEILKGKGTYMVEIISAVCYYKNYDELLGDACPWCSTKDLNREEFDLLKEVFK